MELSPMETLTRYFLHSLSSSPSPLNGGTYLTTSRILRNHRIARRPPHCSPFKRRFTLPPFVRLSTIPPFAKTQTAELLI